MYSVFLDSIMLPVAPSRITTRIRNQNTTVNLINEGEVNLLKRPGLTDINFRALIPAARLPFANYTGGFLPPVHFLDALERLKTSPASFQFIVSRMSAGRLLFDTNITVSLEDYMVIEDAANGQDLNIDIRLKQAVPYGTKVIQLQQPTPEAPAQATAQPPRAGGGQLVIGATVIVNGRLHRDSFGAGPGRTLTQYTARVHLINSNPFPIHVTNASGGWLGWVQHGDITVVA